MEVACRPAATVRVDDGYRLPDPSTPHGRMMVDALRLELLKEGIRQELIVAELAEQQKLGSEVRREFRLENAGPLCAQTGFRPTTLPNHDKSPVRQDDQLKPLLSEFCLDEALMTREGGRALMLKRRPAKERIEEWYQPPWRGRSRDKDNATLIRVTLSKKTLSGVKRKRYSECSAPNKARPYDYEQRTCALRDVNTSGELSFKERCAGQRHTSDIVDLEGTKGTAGLNKIATAVTYHCMQRNPWNCSICQVKCSGELDLKNHLKGRRHQEMKKLYGEKARKLKATRTGKWCSLMTRTRDRSRWACSICKAYCTSESDLDSHLRGRKHQKNASAQFIEENKTALA